MSQVQPPKVQSLQQQLFRSAVLLVIAGVLVILFAKVFVGVILALLGIIAGIGSRLSRNKPLE
ncbi:MAG TPA: hypothetical protein PKA02_02690 [Candidatus Saccharibacteria bacterium]|nr:hypothetical protein [Candidatus Saccharibacteria bacterium]